MLCAFDKDRECTPECAAYEKTEDLSIGEFYWDTSLAPAQYASKKTKIIRAAMCNRMEYPVGHIKVIEKDGMEVQPD